MAQPPPPAYVPVNALALDLEAFVAVRAALNSKIADSRAAFECSLPPPFEHAGFMVLAGLEPLLESLERLKPKGDDLLWLESIGAIDPPTLERLASMRFSCDVDAVP